RTMVLVSSGVGSRPSTAGLRSAVSSLRVITATFLSDPKKPLSSQAAVSRIRMSSAFLSKWRLFLTGTTSGLLRPRIDHRPAARRSFRRPIQRVALTRDWLLWPKDHFRRGYWTP